MPISNAEKQARFRKKEELNKYVGQVFRECQMALPRGYRFSTPAEVESQLRMAAELPAGWTDEDLRKAFRRVENIRLDVFSTADPIGVDLHDGINAGDKFLGSANPQKWKEGFEKEKRDTVALAEHIISAMEISQLRPEYCAAAIMEAVRHVGRALANSELEGQSDAMAACLASVNSHYERPDWFVERFAEWFKYRIDDDTRKAIGAELSKDIGGFK